MICSSLRTSRNLSSRTGRLLSTAAAAISSGLFGAAIASANPPQPDLYDAYVGDISEDDNLYMLVNMTWDGTVYTSELMHIQFNDNGTTGFVTDINEVYASQGYVSYANTMHTLAYNDVGEMGAFADDGSDSLESWIGIDHYGD